MITKEQYESLNPKELKLHSYCQKDLDKTGYMNIRELAANSGVSTATVLRYIQKLGFESYRDFKYWCHHDQDNVFTFHYHSKEIIECLHKMESPFFIEKMEEAVALIASCDIVMFMGIGNSCGVASYGARIFSNKGLFAFCMDDPFWNFKTHPKNMVVIICSVSGETRELIERCDDFQNDEVSFLCITNKQDSTLARMADLSLAYYSQVQKHDMTKLDMSSQIPAIFVIEWLAQACYESRDKKIHGEM